MARQVEQLWNPERGFGLSRRDLAPGRYLAYVPDRVLCNTSTTSVSIRAQLWETRWYGWEKIGTPG